MNQNSLPVPCVVSNGVERGKVSMMRRHGPGDAVVSATPGARRVVEVDRGRPRLRRHGPCRRVHVEGDVAVAVLVAATVRLERAVFVCEKTRNDESGAKLGL